MYYWTSQSRWSACVTDARATMTTTPRKRAGRLKWLWNRLRCMPPGEPLYRLRQAGIARLLRHGWLATTPPAPLAGAGAAPPYRVPRRDDAAAYLREADSIMAGEVLLFATARFQVGAVPRWNTDPLTGVAGPSGFSLALDITDRASVGDIKHVWELSRHLHLVRLAQAWALSGAARYREALALQLDSWLEQCPPMQGPNWTSALELGIRLINWSLIWHIMGGNDGALFQGAAGERLRQRWLASIFSHCQFIQRQLSRHSSANNHLIGELAGLYVASQTWPCWPHSAGWRTQAARELEQQAVRQHSADGVNREQAFAYQVFAAEFLLLAGVSGARAGMPFSDGYWRVLQRATHFLRAVRDVGGHVPMVGDADDGIVFRLEPDDAVDAGDRPAMLLALGDALWGGQAPAQHSATAQWLLGGMTLPAMPAQDGAASAWNFADGGYLLFGSDFGQAAEIKGLLDCGPLGYLGIAAHGHADALALTLSVAGEECLVDPGTYSYWQDIQWRDYFRGTSAHNTLRVDGLDQSVSGGRFMWLRKAAVRILQMPADPAQFAFRGAHDGYARLADPVRHVRSVQFDAATRRLRVDDRIEARAAHALEQFWHFAPGLSVRLEEGVLVVRGARFRLEGRFAGTGLRLQLASASDDPPLGWYSRHYEVKVACTTLCVAADGGDIAAEFTLALF